MPLDTFRNDVARISEIEAVSTILEVVCQTTGMGFAAVARVTEDQWVACAVRDYIHLGVQPGGELKIETTLCNEVRSSGHAIIIDHVTEDPAYRNHHVAKMYGFQSYISMPVILPDGMFFGTLCALDPKPIELSKPEVVGMFKLFADLIGFHLNAQQQLAATQATLFDERQSSELREQFIAVLGHDLRNPLAAINAAARLLLKKKLDDASTTLVNHIGSSVDRMAGLINDVLDLARGKLGGGLSLKRSSRVELVPVLQQVIEELRTAWPDRVIETDLARCGTADCDPVRIGQLLSNLLGNAITHGAADKPIRVEAATTPETFELSVANAGEPIPDAVMQQLFMPFFRANAKPHNQGLGLGLYIASQIARAHGGRLDVSSTPEETRFSFRMPLA